MVYSHPHPVFRWKRFPTLAALCIFVVRGLVVQIGFYEHVRQSVAADIGAWHENTTLVFSVLFFVVLGVAIALFKVGAVSVCCDCGCGCGCDLDRAVTVL